MNKLPIIIALAMLLFAMPVMAQDDDSADTEEETSLDLFDDDTERTEKGWVQFYASFGVTYLDADGVFSANLPNGENVTILDFDRAGLDETDASYWLSLNWRSEHSRWGAWFGSWRYDVTGSNYWEDDLIIPDHDPIPAGAYVKSEFDAKWYILEATYSFYRSETVDTGIGFGFHTVDLSTTLTARIELGEQEEEIVTEQLDTLAPLPNILFYLHWKFTPRWSLVGRFGYFGLDYKDYSGRMTNAHAMFNYDLSQRWVLGLGYQFVDLDLKVDKTEYVQVYEVDFAGPMAYLRVNF
jgi:hypothetical protein